MDAKKLSLLPSFKSKKPLHSNVGKEDDRAPSPDEEARKVSTPSASACGVTTPAKASDRPRRMRHRSAAMSIKEVREAAMMLRESRSARPSISDLEIVSEKGNVPKPKKKSADSETALPEQYKLLNEFFNSLDNSIRLLQLKRYTTTFTNISPQVEKLTDRRFTHGHLAQLKFIMPEAIVVEKVLRHDERTACMKPDLRITLNVDAIDGQSTSSSKTLQLRKVFRNRLLDFFKSHPEGDVVPEGELPEPFGPSRKDPKSNLVQAPSPLPMVGQTVAASHLFPSFKRQFSRQGSTHCIGNLKQHESNVSSDENELSGNGVNSHTESSSKLPCEDSRNDISDSTQPLASSTDKTPVKCIASTPLKLMSSTPSICPPKRSYTSPDDNSITSPNKLVRRPARSKRPLKFSSPDDDIYDILPEDLLQAIQEKERLAELENDPAISQAKKRKQMIDSLPQFFDMTYFLFQSVGCSVLAKEELIQKIITGHLEIVDRSEVEERLRLLQEVAPDWLSEKTSLSGDELICVNKKIIRPDAIRVRLAEAK
ncbi:CDT1-like protein a, chloroplastic [Andrographis paniculata]|uniref:CDT1-like protein a, chloroplastic n=1 Tax=Andrographis paniculata TaxID=175694 RepID=UPI0021E7EDA1|nr:CDT1-like protein a, chloroplastic [Andrographis paniculata]